MMSAGPSECAYVQYLTAHACFSATHDEAGRAQLLLLWYWLPIVHVCMFMPMYIHAFLIYRDIEL